MPVQEEEVTIRHFEQDQLISETVQHRNVHRPGGGRPYIRVTGGRRYLTVGHPAVVEYHARTVQPVDLGAVAAAATAAGRRVRVVVLPGG